MLKPPNDNIELELEGMRYYYRMYPVGTLQARAGRQCPARRRSPTPESETAPILFLSGAWQKMDAWMRYAEYANRIAPVILLDPPGNGCADAAPAHYGREFFDAAILQVLDAERVSRVNLLGYSYGAALAFGLAQSHPERVKRVVLVGTTACVSGAAREALTQAISALQRRQADGFADAVVGNFLSGHANLSKRRLVDRVVRGAFSCLAPEDYWKYEQNAMRLLIHSQQDLSRGLDAPVLVVTGEYDVFTPPDGGRELARACSRSAFTTIRKADHFAYLEQPRTLMELALNFFRELPLGAVPGCSPIEYFGLDQLQEVA